VLVHYRCGGCGATLAARDDHEGRTLPCSVCRHHNVVPHVERAVTQADLETVAEEAARREYAAVIAQGVEEEAGRIAWAEARRQAGRGRVVGAVVVVVGFVVSMGALAGIVTRSMLGFTFPSLSLSVAFGTFGMLIGLSLWRSASSAIEAEYRQLLPVIADQIRQERWRAWEAQRRSAHGARLTVGAAG